MIIQKATHHDLNVIMELVESSRQYMRNHGNQSQWINGYPSEEIIQSSIDSGDLYICVDDNEIHGVFHWSISPDEHYNYIEGGHWLNDQEYGVIHRLAGDGKIKNLGRQVINWCGLQCENVRIDTHESNAPMLQIMKDLEFTYCGVIYVADGSPRLAFHKVFNR